MASNINLFKCPQLIESAKTLVHDLHLQIELAESFVQTKALVCSGRKLTSNQLSRCKSFVRFINGTPQCSLHREISLLNTRELAFLSICFPDERLRKLQPVITAAKLRDYMESQQISEWDSLAMIIHRLAGLAFSEQGIFKLMCDQRGVVWRSKKLRRQDPNSPKNIRRPKFEWPPEADRREAPPNSAQSPNSFVYPLGVCGKLERCLGDDIARCIFRGNGHATESVRARCSRVGDDAIVFLDLTCEENWLSGVFPGHGGGACVSKLEAVFSPMIVNNVNDSELRKWELDKGQHHFTDCVQLVYTLKIRISSAATEVLNHLFQVHEA